MLLTLTEKAMQLLTSSLSYAFAHTACNGGVHSLLAGPLSSVMTIPLFLTTDSDSNWRANFGCSVHWLTFHSICHSTCCIFRLYNTLPLNSFCVFELLHGLKAQFFGPCCNYSILVYGYLLPAQQSLFWCYGGAQFTPSKLFFLLHKPFVISLLLYFFFY